ncbi:MAG: hypothetical protein U0271_09040 [Polyangiaceae bacterium]
MTLPMKGCPQCGAALPVEVDRGVTLCAPCGAALERDDALGWRVHALSPTTPMPAGLSLLRGSTLVTELTGDLPTAATEADSGADSDAEKNPGLLIEQRWSNGAALAEITFSVGWYGVLGWLLRTHADGAFERPVTALLIVSLYGIVCSVVNKTSVTARAGRLSVRHGPLPSYLGFDVSATDVERLSTVHEHDGAAKTYSIVMVDVRGVTRAVLRSIPTRAAALYLQRALEAELGLEEARA